MTGNTVVLVVALLVWGLLFLYLVRLEKRIKELQAERNRVVVAGERATERMDDVGAAVSTHRAALGGRAAVFTAAVDAVSAAGPWSPRS